MVRDKLLPPAQLSLCPLQLASLLVAELGKASQHGHATETTAINQIFVLAIAVVEPTERADDSVRWRLSVSEILRQSATVSLQLTDVRCDSFDLRLAEITRNGLHSR